MHAIAVQLVMLEFARLHNTNQHPGNLDLTPAETEELAELERRYLHRWRAAVGIEAGPHPC